jgi:glycosyltransferase involved in cell wall biosynthesis
VKDGARFLAEALDSVFAQSYRPLDVVVVDGGSTDGSLEIARRRPEVRVVAQRGRGIAGAYNQGVAAARGELVAFLSHDDRWTPEKLARQVEALAGDPALELTIGRVRFFLEPGAAIPPGFRRELLEGDHVGRIMETLCARRSLFDRIGGFDTDLAISEDVDWFARASDAGARMAVLSEVLVEKRVHDRNASLDATAGNRDLMRALRASVRRKRHAVSVVIPVRDGERYLGEAIESVLGGTVAPLEIVVVDDGSRDDSAAVAERFGPPVAVARISPSGPAAARAHGAGLARGEWIAFLDADDLWAPDRLAAQLAAAEEDPSLDALFGHAEEFVAPEVAERFAARAPGPAVVAGTMLVRRAAYQRVGPFDPSIPYGEFLDWYARARDAGLRMLTLDRVLLRRRVHGANLGAREPERRAAYTRVLKAALDRRRGR